jgi:hypothetical protein
VQELGQPVFVCSFIEKGIQHLTFIKRFEYFMSFSCKRSHISKRMRTFAH